MGYWVVLLFFLSSHSVQSAPVATTIGTISDVINVSFNKTSATAASPPRKYACPSSHPILIYLPWALPADNPNYVLLSPQCTSYTQQYNFETGSFDSVCVSYEFPAYTISCASTNAGSDVVVKIITTPKLLETWLLGFDPPYPGIPHSGGVLTFNGNELEVLGYTCFQGVPRYTNLDLTKYFCPAGFKSMNPVIRSSGSVDVNPGNIMAGYCGIPSEKIICYKACNL